jgi:hypothetical protein
MQRKKLVHPEASDMPMIKGRGRQVRYGLIGEGERRHAGVEAMRQLFVASRLSRWRRLPVRVVRTGSVMVAMLLLAASVDAAAPLTPLVSGWEQWFRVDTQSRQQDSRAVVSGVVWNTSGWGARRIQLLVEGLDASGQPVSQRVVWLGADLLAGTHAFFEVPMPAASSYRVSVFAFDRSKRA